MHSRKLHIRSFLLFPLKYSNKPIHAYKQPTNPWKILLHLFLKGFEQEEKGAPKADMGQGGKKKGGGKKGSSSPDRPGSGKAKKNWNKLKGDHVHGVPKPPIRSTLQLELATKYFVRETPCTLEQATVVCWESIY